MTDHDAGCNVTPIDSILALWHCHATKYFMDARICSIFEICRCFVPALECHEGKNFSQGRSKLPLPLLAVIGHNAVRERQFQTWFKIQWLIFSECPDRTWCQSRRDHFRERGQAHHRHTLRQVTLDPRLLQKVPVPSFYIFHWTQNFIVLKGDFWFAKAFFIDDLSLRRPRQFATQEFDDWQFTDWQISDNLTTNNSRLPSFEDLTNPIKPCPWGCMTYSFFSGPDCSLLWKG